MDGAQEGGAGERVAGRWVGPGSKVQKFSVISSHYVHLG
jgi:hypothetical protein